MEYLFSDAVEVLAGPLRGAALAAAVAAMAESTPAARVLPGLQPDGSTLLHNQWPIRPVGRQVPLGDFPVNLAVDPSGRYAAVLHAGRSPHEIRIVDLETGQSREAASRCTRPFTALGRFPRTGGSSWRAAARTTCSTSSISTMAS